LIRHQPIRDVCPFLKWVSRTDIPPPEHEPQPATAYQLTTTFFHLAGSYRIRLAQKTCEEFLEACQTTPDHLLIRPPHIYFRCADRPDHYLRFAWFGYAALLIGET